MNKAMVSVIMPTFNRSDLISHAINSVLRQVYKNWELIIVDDGSSDNTKDVVRSFSEKDSRIRYFYQNNQGQSVARNSGIEQSRGEFIAFLDSDNEWESNRLLLGVNELVKNPNVALCYGNAISIDINGNELHRRNMRRCSGLIFPKLLVDNFISMNSVLVRKSVLNSSRPFNEKNRLDEDYELWLNMSVNNQFFFVNQYIVRYRIEGERISNNYMRRLDANLHTVQKVLKEHSIDTSSKEIREGLAGHYFRRAKVIGDSGEFWTSMNNVVTALKYGINFSALRKAFRITAKSLLALIKKNDS